MLHRDRLVAPADDRGGADPGGGHLGFHAAAAASLGMIGDGVVACAKVSAWTKLEETECHAASWNEISLAATKLLPRRPVDRWQLAVPLHASAKAAGSPRAPPLSFHLASDGSGVVLVRTGGLDIRSSQLPGQRAEEGDDVVFFLVGQLGPELRGAHYADRLLEAPHLPRMEIWRRSATLRSGAARNTYSSLAVFVTAKRPLSAAGSTSAAGVSTTPNGK